MIDHEFTHAHTHTLLNFSTI